MTVVNLSTQLTLKRFTSNPANSPLIGLTNSIWLTRMKTTTQDKFSPDPGSASLSTPSFRHTMSSLAPEQWCLKFFYNVVFIAPNRGSKSKEKSKCAIYSRHKFRIFSHSLLEISRKFPEKMRKLYACFVHRKKIALGIDQQEIINTLKKYLILDDNDINQRFPHNKKFLTIFFCCRWTSSFARNIFAHNFCWSKTQVLQGNAHTSRKQRTFRSEA